MLNSKVRREALEKLEEAVEAHEAVREAVQLASVELFEQRKRAVTEVVTEVEVFVNRLANAPKEFDKTVAEYLIDVSRFDQSVKQLELEAIQVARVGSATGAAGAVAGVGVAAFGPTAALAIATTFGTASTGTAISALSGAAATNAALAWLGGGAIATGGGGMAGGSALLALTGPLGWSVGTVAVLGAGVYLHLRNGKLAQQATQEAVKVQTETRALEAAGREVAGLAGATRDHTEACMSTLDWLHASAPTNYGEFNAAQKERLAMLINHIRTLCMLLRKEVAFDFR